MPVGYLEVRVRTRGEGGSGCSFECEVVCGDGGGEEVGVEGGGVDWRVEAEVREEGREAGVRERAKERGRWNGCCCCCSVAVADGEAGDVV